MNKYIKILDQLPVEQILLEIKSCPEIAWREVDDWVRPSFDKNLDPTRLDEISRKKYDWALKRKNNPDTSREQDRLHLIWQMTPKNSNLEWWLHDDWKNWNPEINPNFGKYFNITINQITTYWEKQGKTLSRLFFSRLLPGKQVYPHIDGVWGDNYNNNERYGMVISTHLGCELTVGNITINPVPGTLYWFDSRKIHSASNPKSATQPRIFLYMDVNQG